MKNRKSIKKSWQKQARRNPLTRRVVGGERLEGREMFSVDMLAIATPDHASNIVQRQSYVHQLVDTVPQTKAPELHLLVDTTPPGGSGLGTVEPIPELPHTPGGSGPGTVEPIPELPHTPGGEDPGVNNSHDDKQTLVTAQLFNGLPIEFLGWIVKSDDGIRYVSLEPNAVERRQAFGVIGHSNDGLPIALSMNQAEKLRGLVEMGDAEGFRTTTAGGAVLFAMFDTDILSKDLLGEAWGSVTLGDDQRNTGGLTAAILFPGAAGEAGADFTGDSFVDNFMSNVASAGWNIGHYASGGYGNTPTDWLKNDSQNWSKGKAGKFILDKVVGNATDQLRKEGYDNLADAVDFTYKTKGIWTKPMTGLADATWSLVKGFWDFISADPLEKAKINLDVCQRAGPPKGCSWAQEDVNELEKEAAEKEDAEKKAAEKKAAEKKAAEKKAAEKEAAEKECKPTDKENTCTPDDNDTDNDTDDDTDTDETDSSDDNDDTTSCPPDMDGCGGYVGEPVDPDSCDVQGGLISGGWQPGTEPSCNSTGPSIDDFNPDIQNKLNPYVNPGSNVVTPGQGDKIGIVDKKESLIQWENLGLITTVDSAFTSYNMELPSDVNGDGFTTPLDALWLINSLNAEGSRELAKARPAAGPFYDVNRDGYATPLDVLTIINRLNNATLRTHDLVLMDWDSPGTVRTDPHSASEQSAVVPDSENKSTMFAEEIASDAARLTTRDSQVADASLLEYVTSVLDEDNDSLSVNQNDDIFLKTS